MTWLAVRNRLTTGDRTKHWDTGASTCVLCSNAEESRSHLFFECEYTGYIWHNLTSLLLNSYFKTARDSLFQLFSNLNATRYKLFLLQYSFQATIYHVWKERNNRKHGRSLKLTATLIQIIDKEVRNKLCAIRKEGDHNYDLGLTKWFTSRLAA